VVLWITFAGAARSWLSPVDNLVDSLGKNGG